MEGNKSIETHYSYQAEYERKMKLENRLPSTISIPNSIDAWRHDRMRDLVLPIVENDKGATWLTLGDGMFGSDAHYLKQQGANVVASSLSDETLKVALDEQFIKDYKIINAEKIEELDGAYDYLYCKEAFHHFPRPYVALYEMLRVASKAVVLTEPQQNKARMLNVLKTGVKRVWRKDIHDEYEITGNYIYRLNVDEVIKIMTALDMRLVAYKKFNDFYMPSIVKGSRKGLNRSKFIFELGLGLQNLLCKIGLMDYGLACVILFKNSVDNGLRSNLKQRGFTFKELPKNPYQQ